MKKKNNKVYYFVVAVPYTDDSLVVHILLVLPSIFICWSLRTISDEHGTEQHIFTAKNYSNFVLILKCIIIFIFRAHITQYARISFGCSMFLPPCKWRTVKLFSCLLPEMTSSVINLFFSDIRIIKNHIFLLCVQLSRNGVQCDQSDGRNHNKVFSFMYVSLGDQM